MAKQTQIENVPRTQVEIQQLGYEVITYLQRLCDDYDNGNTFAIVLVAVLLRTLLKTKEIPNLFCINWGKIRFLSLIHVYQKALSHIGHLVLTYAIILLLHKMCMGGC